MNNVEALANRQVESGSSAEPGLLKPEMPVACLVLAAVYAWGYANGQRHGGHFSDAVDDVAGFYGAEASVDELLRHRTVA